MSIMNSGNVAGRRSLIYWIYLIIPTPMFDSGPRAMRLSSLPIRASRCSKS